MSDTISRRTFFGLGALAGLAGLAACAPPQTSFQPSGPGIIDVVIPYSTGGGTDTWARFITPYLAAKQPDIERYQIENIPGGESITGTNAYVEAGITNGDQLLVSSATTYFQSMLGQSTAEFDFARMEPLVLNGTGAVLWTNPESGIHSVEDLIDNPGELRYGGMSASGLDLVALLALEALGTNVRGVFGMEGRAPTRLAVQRGEADLDLQTTSSYLSQVQPLVDRGQGIPLFSIGIPEGDEIVRDPNIPDVPTFYEIFDALENKTRHQELAFESFRAFVVPGFFYQKGLWANAGTDPEIPALYDDIVNELNSSDEFLEEAESVLGGYALLSGLDVRANFRRALEMDEEVLEYTKKLIVEKYDAVLD